jgi:DNA polymerase-4
MDAFYVNVHRFAHPEDVGIPLVVGGRPEQRGVVSSASYEARRFGVRSAMATSQALRLCPRLKIVPADWPRIRDMSQQVMAVLAHYGPLEKMSVDEAYLDLSQHPDPRPLAREVQGRVRSETALPASVGLATCKLVAKVASDFEKPEGCTIVLPGEEATFLAPLPVGVIWGIGPRTADRLAQIGITTCGQLASADMELVRRHFGRQAENLVSHAKGIDNRAVQPDQGPAKSISQEWTFSQDVTDPERLKEQLREMSAEVARALQKRNLVAHTVRVKLRWSDFTTFTRQRTLELGTAEESVIYHHAVVLWEENWPSGRPVRLIGVGVSNIKQVEEKQLGFSFGL